MGPWVQLCAQWESAQDSLPPLTLPFPCSCVCSFSVVLSLSDKKNKYLKKKKLANKKFQICGLSTIDFTCDTEQCLTKCGFQGVSSIPDSQTPASGEGTSRRGGSIIKEMIQNCRYCLLFMPLTQTQAHNHTEWECDHVIN